MAEVFKREVHYVQVIDENGKVVTHMVFGDVGKFLKKRKVNMTTRNYNGKVITEITNEKE